MESAEINFNFHKLNIEENKNKDKAFLCKKHFMSKDIDFDEFEDGLNISVIDNNEENHKITKTTKNNGNNISIDDDFSQDLDNFNENESQLTTLQGNNIINAGKKGGILGLIQKTQSIAKEKDIIIFK